MLRIHLCNRPLFIMRLPSFNELALDTKANGNKPIRSRYATNMHSNPYFYKYYWWVFWQGSPMDGREFLDKKYQLCTHDTFTLLDQLRANGESWILYNKHSPRYDLINTPFDFDHPQWKNRIFAPPFEQDTDPIWISKSGVSYK